MASRIRAIKAMQASIEAERTAEMRDRVKFMQRRTGLNAGEAWQVLMEFRDALIFFAQHGQALKLPKIGTFTPTLRADGDFHITFRPAVEIKNALNNGDFSGTIRNKGNRGKSAEELVALWNELHPEDPVKD